MTDLGREPKLPCSGLEPEHPGGCSGLGRGCGGEVGDLVLDIHPGVLDVSPLAPPVLFCMELKVPGDPQPAWPHQPGSQPFPRPAVSSEAFGSAMNTRPWQGQGKTRVGLGSHFTPS